MWGKSRKSDSKIWMKMIRSVNSDRHSMEGTTGGRKDKRYGMMTKWNCIFRSFLYHPISRPLRFPLKQFVRILMSLSSCILYVQYKIYRTIFHIANHISIFSSHHFLHFVICPFNLTPCSYLRNIVCVCVCVCARACACACVCGGGYNLTYRPFFSVTLHYRNWKLFWTLYCAAGIKYLLPFKFVFK
jgi:hypothetical protein